MTALALPQPADGLWRDARDVIEAEMPRRDGWERYIGGGTILAACWRHRKSTDVDVNVPTNRSLRPIARILARELNGTIEKNGRDRIVVTTTVGKLDLNRARLEPRGGMKEVTIAGRTEPILSTAQILYGKLDRAIRSGPVRDAYDIIRAVEDRAAAAALTTAYSMLDEDQQDGIEASLHVRNEDLKKDAFAQLELTEESRVDWDVIGTTAAQVLAGHRLTRVVLRLEDDRIMADRETANGSRFHDSWDWRNTHDRCMETGLQNVLEDRGLYVHRMTAGISAYRTANRSCILVDTADEKSIERFRRAARPAPAPERPPMHGQANGRQRDPERG